VDKHWITSALHRDSQRTANPHVIVTKGTKSGRAAASGSRIPELTALVIAPARA
jgi:hypothetical protein